MEKLTEEKAIEILNSFNGKIAGDKNKDLKGLNIISKYLDSESCLIGAAEHDIIYCAGIEELIKAGITEEDLKELNRLGFHEEDESVCRFI